MADFIVATDNSVEVANALRRLRRFRGVTQEELAAKLGVQQSGLSQMENGTKGLPVQRMFDIATLLGYSVTITFKEGS